MSEIDSRKKMSINLNKLGSLDSNASFHLFAQVPSVPHWWAGYSASIFSLAGWKIIFWIPVFLLFKITRSGNQRYQWNLNKLAKWLNPVPLGFQGNGLTCRSLHWSDWAQYCAVRNELLSIVFVFRNRNIYFFLVFAFWKWKYIILYKEIYFL